MRSRDRGPSAAVDESSCYPTRLDLPEACNQGSMARRNEGRQRTKASAYDMVVDSLSSRGLAEHRAVSGKKDA